MWKDTWMERGFLAEEGPSELRFGGWVGLNEGVRELIQGGEQASANQRKKP
jgi:hypothetical protein